MQALAPSEDTDTDPLENSEILLELARALVDFPQEVKIEERKSRGDGSTVLVIKAAKADRGKLIGKGGATINHIRGLFDRIAAADRTRLFIEVADDNTGRRRRRTGNGRRAA